MMGSIVRCYVILQSMVLEHRRRSEIMPLQYVKSRLLETCAGMINANSNTGSIGACTFLLEDLPNKEGTIARLNKSMGEITNEFTCLNLRRDPLEHIWNEHDKGINAVLLLTPVKSKRERGHAKADEEVPNSNNFTESVK